MQFEIFPFKGVGDIEFGMVPSDVRRHFSSTPMSFMKTPDDSFPCDYFKSEGIFFYYDGSGHLEAVEFSQPSRPIVRNLDLLGLNLKEATDALSSLDSEVEKESDGAIAYHIGVSIYAPLAKKDNLATVETVLAFKSGYYN